LFYERTQIFADSHYGLLVITVKTFSWLQTLKLNV
jgi:hypothetical protein